MEENNQIPTSSPLPPSEPAQVKTYDFYTALQELAAGKRITKQEWANPNVYGILSDAIVMIMTEKEGLKAWTISDGDLAGLDWVVLD